MDRPGSPPPARDPDWSVLRIVLVVAAVLLVLGALTFVAAVVYVR